MAAIGQTVTLSWEAVPAATYKVYSSTNLTDWTFRLHTVSTSAEFPSTNRAEFFKVLTFTGNPVRVTLAWDPSPEYSVKSYNLYFGQSSRAYPSKLHTTNATATVSNLVAGATYYFAVTAETDTGLESDYSSEVVHTAEPVGVPVNGLRIR